MKNLFSFRTPFSHIFIYIHISTFVSTYSFLRLKYVKFSRLLCSFSSVSPSRLPLSRFIFVGNEENFVEYLDVAMQRRNIGKTEELILGRIFENACADPKNSLSNEPLLMT